MGKKGFVQGAQLPGWGSWEAVGWGGGGEVRRAEGRVQVGNLGLESIPKGPEQRRVAQLVNYIR